MRDTTVLRRLLALPGIGVSGVELTAEGLIVDVRLRRATRLRCPEHGVVTEAVPFAPAHSGSTYAFEDEVAWLAQRADKTAITLLLRISWRSVGRILERWIARHRSGGRTRSDDRVVRRSQLAAELERLRNLYRWGDLEQRDFLTQRTAVQRAIEELGPDIAPRPSRDALKLAGEIGRAWNDVSAQTRRRFLEEWFEQILIHRDGRVEVMPREAVRGIVYAAQVGIAGSPPALPTGASSTHTGEARIKPVGPPHRAHQ